MSPRSVCISIGNEKSLRGFEVGCASVSISELGTAQPVVGNSSVRLPTSARNALGFSPLIQPKKHGSCCHRYSEYVSTGRVFTQIICWRTKAPASFQTDS